MLLTIRNSWLNNKSIKIILIYMHHHHPYHHPLSIHWGWKLLDVFSLPVFFSSSPFCSYKFDNLISSTTLWSIPWSFFFFLDIQYRTWMVHLSSVLGRCPRGLHEPEDWEGKWERISQTDQASKWEVIFSNSLS